MVGGFGLKIFRNKINMITPADLCLGLRARTTHGVGVLKPTCNKDIAPPQSKQTHGDLPFAFLTGWEIARLPHRSRLQSPMQVRIQKAAFSIS